MFLAGLSDLGLHFVHILETKTGKCTCDHMEEVLIPKLIEADNDMIAGKRAFEATSGLSHHPIRRSQLEWLKVYLAKGMTYDNGGVLGVHQERYSTFFTGF